MPKRGVLDPAKEERWRRVIAEQEKAGLNAAAYCREQKISYDQFKDWNKKIKRRDSERNAIIEAPAASAKRVKVERQKRRVNLLTRREASAYLGVSEQTLAIWSSTGRYGLPVIKVGRLAKYNREDLDLFLKRRTRKPNSDNGLHSRLADRNGNSMDGKIKRAEEAEKSVEFAEVQVVERQHHRASKDADDAALEIVFASGTKLRLSAGCPLDLLSSVVAVLENR